VQLLLERGELRTAHGENAEDVDIDVTSIDAYRARLDEARRRYFASQNEGDEPLGG
jgi:DNA-binding IclR family transcriptional regulator